MCVLCAHQQGMSGWMCAEIVRCKCGTRTLSLSVSIVRNIRALPGPCALWALGERSASERIVWQPIDIVINLIEHSRFILTHGGPACGVPGRGGTRARRGAATRSATRSATAATRPTQHCVLVLKAWRMAAGRRRDGPESAPSRRVEYVQCRTDDCDKTLKRNSQISTAMISRRRDPPRAAARTGRSRTALRYAYGYAARPHLSPPDTLDPPCRRDARVERTR